jgi:PRD1 phage membrane DNA delivery
MSEAFLNSLVTVALAIVAVGTLAVVLSKQSDTSNVIGAASGGFSKALSTALSPITGGTGYGNLSTPSFSGSNAGYNY